MTSNNIFPMEHSGAAGLASLIHPAHILSIQNPTSIHGHFSLSGGVPHGISHITPYTKKVSGFDKFDKKKHAKKQSLFSIIYFIFSTTFILMTALAWNKSITETIQDIPMNYRIAQWTYTMVITLLTMFGMYFLQPKNDGLIVE